MRKRKRPGSNDDPGGGGVFDLTPPQIDLPPGIDWPKTDPVSEKSKDKILV